MHGMKSMLGASVIIVRKQRASMFADVPHDVDPLLLIHQPTRIERCSLSQAAGRIGFFGAVYLAQTLVADAWSKLAPAHHMRTRSHSARACIWIEINEYIHAR